MFAAVEDVFGTFLQEVDLVFGEDNVGFVYESRVERVEFLGFLSAIGLVFLACSQVVCTLGVASSLVSLQWRVGCRTKSFHKSWLVAGVAGIIGDSIVVFSCTDALFHLQLLGGGLLSV